MSITLQLSACGSSVMKQGRGSTMSKSPTLITNEKVQKNLLSQSAKKYFSQALLI